MHELNNEWTLWLHQPHDIDWSINSYKKVYTFNNLENCITLIENINEEIVQKCMLFIMKDNIKPIWEDPKNSKGGSLSYKISVDNIYSVWKVLTYYLIGNTICGHELIMDSINGISVSPKKNFCIIKFWFSSIEHLKENYNLNYFDISNNNDNDNDNDIDKSNENMNDDPFNIHLLCDVEKHNPLFKLHNILY